jgi:MOSC domain-containing protein YiiM
VGRIVSINVSAGGVPKRPVSSVGVSASGVEGDTQRDQRHHGGPDRAVSLFSLELIRALREEGHPIEAGSTGENLTLEGLAWDAVGPGARVRFAGGVELEVTAYTTPCSAIRESFLDGAIRRIAQKDHPGWSRVYARVIRPGRLTVGEVVTLAAKRR